jgi:uncharacterized protein YajQ (UPF0234 family)
MAQDHSFDIVSRPSLQEIDNAVSMAMKEISQRFDFKGSISRIEKEGGNLRLLSEDDFKLKNVFNVLQDKLVKRKVNLKFFELGKVEDAAGGHRKQLLTLKQGIPQEKAKEITKLIKASGLKVQAAIQGDQVRVSAKKIDDLQAVMQKLRAANLPIVLQFVNYR